MFELDDNFFQEVGMNNLPASELEAFKNHVEEELQIRVGERISDGLPLEKLEEFEKIIDGDTAVIDRFISQNAPDYHRDEVFLSLVQANGLETPEVLGEYAGMKWLQLNRPDFTQIISTVVADMKSEIRSNASKIIE